MWLFLPTGFVSIVRHRDQPENVMVRARTREHLAEFVRLRLGNWPRVEDLVEETPGADYRFRIILPDHVVRGILWNAVRTMSYDNFKDSTHGDPEYSRACSGVWTTMGRLQQGGPFGGGGLEFDYNPGGDEDLPF